MSFFLELKRRNVFRVAAAYLVAGWLLTEVFTTILPTVGAPAWMSRAVVLVFALGFLPTVIVAWVYQITPEGIRRQSIVDDDDSLSARRGRRLEFLTLAVVVTGILFLAVFGSQRESVDSVDSVAEVPPMSIAVLPFVNMSDSQDNEYFSDGLTETLLHMLAQVPGLKVAARTSSFSFKNKNLPIGEIATALGVAHILEGSVQRSGDRVRITAQLIRSRDQFHVWSANYDRTLDDIFAIQDEIAGDVGAAMSKSILGVAPAAGESARSTEYTDAYDLYLQALQQRSTFSHWGLRAEQDLLKGALAVDPDFIDAKLALAYNYLRQSETGLMEESLALRQMLATAEQVLLVRPQDPDARAIRLFIDSSLQTSDVTAGKVNAAIAGLREIVAEHPDKLDARFLLVRRLSNVRDFGGVETLLNEALKTDPLNPAILYRLGVMHANLSDSSQAIAYMQRSLDIEPRQPNAHSIMSSLSQVAGDGVGAVRHMLKSIEYDPTDHELSAELAQFLYELGLIEEADDFRKRVLSIAPTSSAAYEVNMLRALAVGDDDALYQTAREAIRIDVSNRRDAYVDAVHNLLSVAIRRGVIEEELAFIEQSSPGIFAYDSAAPSLKSWAAQFAAMDAWFVARPKAELLERLAYIERMAAEYGFSIDDNPALKVSVLALLGKSAEAIELALDQVFVDSVLRHPSWQERFEHAQYAEIVSDSRVQRALGKWSVERTKVRKNVAEFLQTARVET